MNFDVLNGYMHLAAAIVQAAIEDYKTAVAIKDESGKKALEKWFNDEWCETLTMGNGPYILRKVQKELGCL